MTLPFDHPRTSALEGKFFGKYRAFVRDFNDPERLGRLRLEVPAVLGTGKANWSEWAWPCWPVGGNPDTGQFLLPDEGSSAWAEFEGGDPGYPIWSGVFVSGSNPGELPTEATRLCDEPTCLDCEDKLDHANDPVDGPEHRKFHGHPSYSCPRLRVVFKSETGHTLLADDKDEHEYFAMIDRAGQVFEMFAPVRRELNVGNAERRGERTAVKGDQVPLDKLADQHSWLRLMDLARQFIQLDAWKDREKITIQSGDTNRSRVQRIEIDTTKNQEKVTVSGLNGGQSLVIDCAAGKETITLTDKAGQTFTMDATPGKESVCLRDKVGQTITMRSTPPSVLLKDASGGVVLMDAAAGMITVKAANKVLVNP